MQQDGQTGAQWEGALMGIGPGPSSGLTVSTLSMPLCVLPFLLGLWDHWWKS